MSTDNLRALSVLICTARRPDFLRDLLMALNKAHVHEPIFDLEVVVIDNDELQSAQKVTYDLINQLNFTLRYIYEATSGVSSARNTAIANAKHPLCLFLDDDQIIETTFFRQLFETTRAFPQDFSAIRLHVGWKFETFIPRWLERGLSRDAAHKNTGHRHGKPLKRKEMGTGGLLINKNNLIDQKTSEPLFDVTLNEIGGEDVSMFLKAVVSGKTFYYASSPSVIERVAAERATVHYGLRTALRKGFVDATLALRGARLSTKISFFALTLLYLATALVLLPLSAFGGRLKIFNTTMKLWRQFGKCKALFHGKLLFYGKAEPKAVVLHLTGGGHDGGAEKIIEQISVHTPEESVKLCFYFYDSSGPRAFSKVISKRWQKVVHRKKSKGLDWALWLQLAQFVRTEKITVIHTHDIGAMLHANVARLINPHIRLVHTEHTLHYWINTPKYRRLYYILSLSYSSIACVSAYVKNEIVSKIGIAERKLKVIPNGVDVAIFDPRQTETKGSRDPKQPLALISVSRIDANKNVEQILRALAIVRRRGLNVMLTHVGSGSEENVKKLSELAHKLGIKDYVTFAGFQSQVAPWLLSADCFVSASKVECHPVSVLEALASGKPCILSGIAPHQEVQSAIINSGIILFGDHDDALADAIESMHKNFNDHKISAYQSIELIRTHYSVPVMLARYSALYAHR